MKTKLTNEELQTQIIKLQREYEGLAFAENYIQELVYNINGWGDKNICLDPEFEKPVYKQIGKTKKYTREDEPKRCYVSSELDELSKHFTTEMELRKSEIGKLLKQIIREPKTEFTQTDELY